MTPLLLLLLPAAWAQLTAPVDLTQNFDENTIYWGGNKPMTFSYVKNEETKGVWTATRDFTGSEQLGTHMNAPFHYNKNGWRIGDIPFQRFFGKGMLGVNIW